MPSPSAFSVVEALREDVRPIAESNGVKSYVTGPGGLLGDLFGAFETLDSSLLLTTLSVVSIILIVVYRSPTLWIIPLLCAIIALGAAGANANKSKTDPEITHALRGFLPITLPTFDQVPDMT